MGRRIIEFVKALWNKEAGFFFGIDWYGVLDTNVLYHLMMSGDMGI